MKRLGYWMNEKKSRKFTKTEFPEKCRLAGLELVQIDLNQPLEEQGPFSIILHKLTDVIAKADAIGDADELDQQQCMNIVKAFEDYVAAHPDMLIIDQIDNVRTLLDRSKTYKLIEESPLAKEDGVFTPSFVQLTTTNPEENLKLLQEAGVGFPFICKPSLAHGTKLAHKMAIIFNEEGLKNITPPCVAQTFICHNAVLYKLFAVGDKWFTVERPSLKNFYVGDFETIFFDSHDVSKADSATSLNQLDKEDQGKPVPKPSQKQFQKIMSTIRQNLNMALFGVDVVIESDSGRYAIIDINAFPGYDGVPDFFETLITFMLEEFANHERNGEKPSPSNYLTSPSLEEISAIDSSQEDSGIDTGDSSDEKKNKKSMKVSKRHTRSQASHSPITT